MKGGFITTNLNIEVKKREVCTTVASVKDVAPENLDTLLAESDKAESVNAVIAGLRTEEVINC